MNKEKIQVGCAAEAEATILATQIWVSNQPSNSEHNNNQHMRNNIVAVDLGVYAGEITKELGIKR